MVKRRGMNSKDSDEIKIGLKSDVPLPYRPRIE